MHGGLGARVEDFYCCSGGRQPGLRRGWTVRGARGCARFLDLIVLRPVDPTEAHVIARAEKDRVGGPGIVELQRCASEHPVAAGALDRVDAALDAADPDAARRHFRARRLEPRDVERIGHAPHVGQAWREPDEIDEVVGAGVELHELIGAEPEPLGGGHQIEAELGIVVAAGQLHCSRGWQHGRVGLVGDRGDRGAQGFVRGDARVVVDEQRAEARRHLGDAGQALLLDQVFERANAGVELYADLLAEDDGNGEITCGKEAQKPLSTRAPRAASSGRR